MNINTDGKTKAEVMAEVDKHFAQPKLEDCEYYLCNVGSYGPEQVGRYSSIRRALLIDLSTVDVSCCKNIRRLIEAPRIQRILNNTALNLSERLNAISEAIK